LPDSKATGRASQRRPTPRPPQSAARGLLRRGELRALGGILARRGEPAWIVGGAPRDLALGRTVFDVDVAVASDPRPLAGELEARGLGRCVLLSDSSPVVYRVAGRREIDLAQLEGPSIEQDLARRDFTVNAMALEIPGGAWLDPFGGLKDLRARRLREPRPGNFREDPLRVFRAARFLATHRLRPDAATSRAAAEAAPALASVAPERLKTELSRLLEADLAAPALRWAARSGALAPALGVPAPDVRRLRSTLGRLDEVTIRRLEPASRRRLRLALLAEGLDRSPAATSRWLLERRFSREEALAVSLLQELVARARQARGDRDAWAWVRDAGADAPAALTLWRVLRPRERAQAGTLSRRSRRARRGPAIRGTDLLSWLGLAPGPRVGELLRDVEIEILRGAVTTRREARRWLSDRIPRG
jgi:tRNA nucleotidyltransferase/poly(A) polymerase